MMKVFVVDTCVSRAAGGEQAAHPTSQHSRAFLRLLQDGGHSVAFDAEGLDEWKQHRSRFAYTWLSAMYARKRVVRIQKETGEHVRAQLAGVADLEQHHRRAIDKDAHIVGAAMSSDRMLASIDDRLLKALLTVLTVCGSMTCIRGLVWIDVLRYCDELAAWVGVGAPLKKLPVADVPPVTVLK